MRRMRLRTMMIAIALVAVLLRIGVGLMRRARGLNALALAYGREAQRLENLWIKSGPTSPDETDSLMEQVHWHDSVATNYWAAASRPWILFDPNPETTVCGCGYHAAQRAGTAKQVRPAE